MRGTSNEGASPTTTYPYCTGTAMVPILTPGERWFIQSTDPRISYGFRYYRTAEKRDIALARYRNGEPFPDDHRGEDSASGWTRTDHDTEFVHYIDHQYDPMEEARDSDLTERKDNMATTKDNRDELIVSEDGGSLTYAFIAPTKPLVVTIDGIDYKSKYEKLVRDLKAQAVKRKWCAEFDRFAEEAGIPKELLKPATPNQDERDYLPNGSVIRFNNEVSTWHKIKGEWTSSTSATLYGDFEVPAWIQHVVFNPEA